MTIQLTSAARVLAMLRSRNAVKDHIRRRGLKPSNYAASEITSWAIVYLDEHPELIPEAIANARAMILEGVLGKRAQRELRAEIESVLGGLAEFERHLILARTSEGRARAQARGVRFGRKLKLTVHQQQEALARRAAGEALVDIARSYAVSHSTISRLA